MRVEAPGSFRDGDVDPIPVQAETAIGASFFQGVSRNHFPFAVVELRFAGIRRKIVGAIRRSAGLKVEADAAMLNFIDERLTVSPLPAYPRCTFGRAQV